MANFFETPSAIAQEMLDDLKDLAGLSFKLTDLGREEVIKILQVATVVSMSTARQQRIYDDIFPDSASEEGLEKHLIARGLPERFEPQPAAGTIRLPGTNGTVVQIGTQLKRKLTGAIYVATEAVTVASGHADVVFESLLTGSAQNVDSVDEEFTLVSPVVGLDGTGTNQTAFLGARDRETKAEMLERIHAHDRNETTGGNPAQYEAWAREASAAVVTAKTTKHVRGVGTVDTVITSGTTDIEGTIRAGNPVLRLPGTPLINTVQAYIIAANPTTDDHLTVAPTEDELDVTVGFNLHDESIRATVEDEVEIATKVFIYSARSGDTIHPSDLERDIDRRVGHLISERRVSDFGVSTAAYTIPQGKLLKPGTLTFETVT